MPGLYQVAFSKANDALFVAAPSGRGPDGASSILRVDPQTLETLAAADPATDAAGGVIGAFGIATEDANGNVRVRNTRNDSVAVYRQDDLTLVKQFDAVSVEKPRDIAIDQASNCA